jgi:hypothetical protein
MFANGSPILVTLPEKKLEAASSFAIGDIHNPNQSTLGPS